MAEHPHLRRGLLTKSLAMPKNVSHDDFGLAYIDSGGSSGNQAEHRVSYATHILLFLSSCGRTMFQDLQRVIHTHQDVVQAWAYRQSLRHDQRLLCAPNATFVKEICHGQAAEGISLFQRPMDAILPGMTRVLRLYRTNLPNRCRAHFRGSPRTIRALMLVGRRALRHIRSRQICTKAISNTVL
nr:hypothetical protein CFP56_09267 [Quercus suber]